ncbi:MAG: lamin tail domain-containing protein [Anaerolineales bacterium]|nr:lamin tail domain-containing protein [Anaerolineales bacterium]
MTINISGWQIRVLTGTGTEATRVTITAGTQLSPGQYYLVANTTASTGYSGIATPDQTYTTGIVDGGGIALFNGSTKVDSVGLNTTYTTYTENTPLSELNSDSNSSYQRKLGGAFDSCQDDNNNSNDFQLISPSNPQNSSTPRRGCGLSSDLQLAQTVSNFAPTAGMNIDFTLTVTNNGINDATSVSVKDVLPAGLVYQSSIATIGTYDNSMGIWNVGNLNAGISATLTITTTVTSFGTKTNIAEVWTSDQVDPDSVIANGSSTEDDYASTQVTPLKVAGLNITNTVNNSNPLVGTNVIFTIKVDNPVGNPYNATNVNVSALLPAGLTYVSSAATSGTYTSSIGSWFVGTIPIGSSATLTVTARVINSTPNTYSASVTSNEYLDNSASSSLNNPLSGQADLAITQALDLNTGTVGQVNLVLSLKNDGPDTATGVEVRDLLPSGLAYVSHTSTAGTYDQITGIWVVGSLNNGTTVNLTIKVKVAASGSSTNNTVQIWKSNQFDTDSLDNSDSLEVPIADLSLIQTVDLTATTAIFTITVTNSGPDDATVKVKSNLPDVNASYQFVSSSQPAAFDPLTGIWNLGLLADGASAALVITTNTTGVLQSHIVEISSSDMVDPDSIPNNLVRSEDDISGLPFADLSLTQTVDNASPNLNANVVFTIRVSNSGPTAVTGVKVKSLLPSGLPYVSSSTATGSYVFGTGIWTVGTLASGTTAELKITANVSISGSFVNLAEVFESGLYDPDSIPGNGLNTEDDNASASVSTVAVVRSVIINEVAWGGTGSASNLIDDEWIELYNTTGSAINLTGWTLKASDGAPSILLNAGCAAISIPAGGYYLLERDDDTTVFDIAADCIYSGSLSNSGETLTLYDPSNTVIDTANGNGGSWPAGSSSTYGTMERNSSSADSDSNWHTNTGAKRNGKNANNGDILGTPKASNSVSPTATPTATPIPTPTQSSAPVVIPPRPILNEILARPGFDWNQDGRIDTFDEFIEIKNIAPADLNLSGWRLDDGLNEGSNPYTLPNITLRPGQRIALYTSQTNILLSDGGDTVRLLDPGGKVYDIFTYSIARTADHSFCRLPDGTPTDSAWADDCIPTPNLTNTREGLVPVMPGGNPESPVCQLPDTIPADFLLAECHGYGANIWNSYYWDRYGWQGRRYLPDNFSKWESFIE